MAGLMIANMLEDWDSNPTITTLDSIAVPIREVPFPTVTICPDDETPPDNWALPEILYNNYAFECYKHDTRVYPNCSETAKAKKEFQKVIKEVYDSLKAYYFANDKKDLPGSDINELEFTKDTIWMIMKNKIPGRLNAIQNVAVDRFADRTSIEAAMKEIADYSQVPAYNQICVEMKCNEQYTDVIEAYVKVGSMMLSTFPNMPLGHFLYQFINVTSPLSMDNAKLMTTVKSSVQDICSSMNEIETLLHSQFVQLAKDLGINESISIFDIPSMVAKPPKGNGKIPTLTVQQSYMYSQCKFGHDAGTFLADCVHGWELFFSGAYNKTNPCDDPEYKGLCCNYWTGLMGHNLKAVMKVMRMANRRATPMIDLEDILKGFKSFK